jgi:hypothetical protein
MTRSISITLLIAMLLCALLAGWLIMSRRNTFEATINRIEALPASIHLREIKESGMKEISFIRLLPAQGDRKRDFQLLSSSVALTIKGFDASDCRDFGDQELSYLSDARQIQYLGLDGTSITDLSLSRMKNSWPALRFLDLETCNVSQNAILDLLQSKHLVFIEISEELSHGVFIDEVRRISPDTIVMCNGQDLMNQPESVFNAIPWSDWKQ